MTEIIYVCKQKSATKMFKLEAHTMNILTNETLRQIKSLNAERQTKDTELVA